MNFKTLLNEIENDKIGNLYLLYGREGFLIDIIVKKLKDKYINNLNINFNYFVLEGDNLLVEDLINNCETAPFMGEKKIIIIKKSNLFSYKTNILNEEFLIKYLKNVPNSSILIFIEGEGIDKRKKIYKEIKKYGKVYEFSKLSRIDLIKWIRNYFNKKKKYISNNNINYIIDIIGYDDRNSNKTLYDIDNELKKICDYVGNDSEITREAINDILNKSLENNIFALIDAVAEKKVDKGLNILNQLLTLGEPEVKILHMLVRQFKILNSIKMMIEKGYTAAAILPKLSIPNYILKKNIKQTSYFSTQELLNILNLSFETDNKIKSGNINPRLALELLIIRCCQ